MLWRPPITTRTDTPFPSTTLFRSWNRGSCAGGVSGEPRRRPSCAKVHAASIAPDRESRFRMSTQPPRAGGAPPGILTLHIKDKSALYVAYMPFVKNGGLFIPTDTGNTCGIRPGRADRTRDV